MRSTVGYYHPNMRRHYGGEGKKKKKVKKNRYFAKAFLTYFIVLVMSLPVAYVLGKAGVSIKVPKKILTFKTY